MVLFGGGSGEGKDGGAVRRPLVGGVGREAFQRDAPVGEQRGQRERTPARLRSLS